MFRPAICTYLHVTVCFHEARDCPEGGKSKGKGKGGKGKGNAGMFTGHGLQNGWKKHEETALDIFGTDELMHAQEGNNKRANAPCCRPPENDPNKRPYQFY